MSKREWGVWVARRWISVSNRGCSHTSCPIMLLGPVFWTEFPFPNFRGLNSCQKHLSMLCFVNSNLDRFIPNSGSLLLSANTSSCSSTPSEIRRLEHVQINITLHHRHRGDLSITLISPSGTRSKMLTTRRNDHSPLGLKVVSFTVTAFLNSNNPY